MQDATKHRVRELVTEVAAEKDHDKFSARVEELNRLLDSEPLAEKSPAPEERQERATERHEA